MDRRAVFEAWTPQGAPWSRWVKPVVFAHVDDATSRGETERAKPRWIETAIGTALDTALPPEAGRADYRSGKPIPRSALLIDLPGERGVEAGIALLQHGFQPIPLYTALPGPALALFAPVVPMEAVLQALVEGVAELQRSGVAANASPAFLLDARRAGVGVTHSPGRFDNRSLAFPHDFPSTRQLQAAGIARAILVQEGSDEPSPDLLPTLLDWQKAGVDLFLLRAEPTEPPSPPRTLVAPTPSLIRRAKLWWTRRGLHGDEGAGFGASELDHPLDHPQGG